VATGRAELRPRNEVRMKRRGSTKKKTRVPMSREEGAGLDPLSPYLDEVGFEIIFLEPLAEALPACPEVLKILAEHYTTAGRYTDGLALDRRLAHLRPDDPVVHYNLGCSLSLVGSVEEALETLVRAIHLGYNDFDHMRADPDLENARRDPRFEMLLGESPE
jgi:hypothetical protein